MGHDQLAARHLACLQGCQPTAGEGKRFGKLGTKTSSIAPICQDLEHAQLGFLDVARRIAAAGLDAAHLQRAVFKGAEIAVGDGDARLGAGGQERQPAIDPLQVDQQPGLILDLGQKTFIVRAPRRPRLVDPQPVDVQMQHAETLRLDDFL